MQVSHFFEVKLRPWDVVSAGVFIPQDLMASPTKIKEKKNRCSKEGRTEREVTDSKPHQEDNHFAPSQSHFKELTSSKQRTN
jgi:hypothetical protein